MISDSKTDIRETLNERGARYGLFIHNAIISNDVLNILRATEGWKHLDADMITALEIIVQKIARALSGDPHYDDNWRDIAGYAQLIVDRLNGTGIYSKLVELTDTLITGREGGVFRCFDCHAVVGDVHAPDCPQRSAISPLGRSTRS